MESIYLKDKMYMSDEESYVVSEFDMMDESLKYTLDFNTKGGLSIFSNIYDTKHPKNSWNITITEDNLFYNPLLEFLQDNSYVFFKDHTLSGRTLMISIEDDIINLNFTSPYDITGVVNIRLGEDDPNKERFLSLLSSLNNIFKTYNKTK